MATSQSGATAMAESGPALWKRFPVFFGPSGLRAGWRVVLFALLAILLGDLTFLVALRPSFEHGFFGWPPAKLLVLWLWFTIPVFAAAAIMARIEGRAMGAYGLPGRMAFGARFWEGALWGLAFLTLLLTVQRLAGGFYFGRVLLHGADAWRWGLGWGVAFVFVGLLQEFLHSGYPLFTLAQGMGFWPAALLLSLAFGLAHLPNPGVNTTFIAGTILVGLFWCFTLRRTGDLWFAVGMHSAWDWAGRFLYDADREVGRLLESSSPGPVWLSGGAGNPEGSVLVFPLILLMWLAVAVRFPGRSAGQAAR